MKTVTTEQYEASREAYRNAQCEFRAIAERSIAQLLPVAHSAILDISDTPRLALYRVLDASGNELEDLEFDNPDLWEHLHYSTGGLRMTTATSSSDRYAEARAALAAFEVYMDNFTADEFAPEVHRLAEALRAVIEPAAVEESVEDIAAGIVVKQHRRDGEWFPRDWNDVQALLEQATLAGIQAERETQLVDIVFGSHPDHEPDECRLFGVEDVNGASLKVGEWFELAGGRWALRVEVVK